MSNYKRQELEQLFSKLIFWGTAILLTQNKIWNMIRNFKKFRICFSLSFFFAQFLSVVTFAFKHCKFLHQMQKYSKNNIHHGKSDLS